MCHRIGMVCCIALIVMLVSVPGVFAQSPVQLSLINPIQIVSENASVEGVSLGVLYTVNYDVTGINWTGVANRVNGDMKGWQGALVNFVEGDTWGLQEGFYNAVEGTFLGWQCGFVNINQSLTHGLQTGLYNQTNRLKGVQVGLLNMTDTLHGLQIGLLNMNSSGEPYGMLPIVNWSF